MEIKELVDLLGIGQYGGSSTKVGTMYHELPFEEFKFPVHRRRLHLRVEKILGEIPVKYMRGLDLGCNVGGITFSLQLAGANMVGIDYDKQAIQVAQGVEEYKNTGAVFLNKSITLEFVEKLEYFDFTVFFDTWMWISKFNGREYAEKLLKKLSEKTTHLFFSVSQGKGKAHLDFIESKHDVLRLLRENTIYNVFRDLGTVEDGWHPRNIFHCF